MMQSLTTEVLCHLESPAERLLRQWPAEALLGANLEALEIGNPLLAKELGSVAVPESYELAVANDGSVTFFNRCGGDKRWFDDCSLPVLFAHANSGKIDVESSNLALQGMGSGADVEAILLRMSPFQALLVVEPDLLTIHLAFQLRDFTRDLQAGRLVILRGDQASDLVADFHMAHPGYNLVQKAITLPRMSHQENHAFAGQISLAVDRCLGPVLDDVRDLTARQAKRDQQSTLADALKRLAAPQAEMLKVTNCSNAYNTFDHDASRDALAGLVQLGADTEWFVYDRPDCVSPRVQLERLGELAPQLIVLVDALRGDMAPEVPASAICATLVRELPAGLVNADCQPAQRLGPNDFLFAETEAQLDSLQKAGFGEDRLALLPLAANTELFRPVTAAAAEVDHFAADVALLAHRDTRDPKAYHINLPTHQRLWQRVIDEIAAAPETYHAHAARRFLLRSQNCGVGLREEELRQHFIDLLQNHLGDAVLTDTYCQALDQAGVDLRIWEPSPLGVSASDELSEGWQESPLAHRVAGSVGDADQRNLLYNTARIHLSISSTGQVSREMLEGIAAGAFFLVRSHPQDKEPGGLGDFFEMGKEIITFDSCKDLVRKVDYYLANDQERKALAVRACTKCLERHSYKVRMGQMLDRITAGLAG